MVRFITTRIATSLLSGEIMIEKYDFKISIKFITCKNVIKISSYLSCTFCLLDRVYYDVINVWIKKKQPTLLIGF